MLLMLVTLSTTSFIFSTAQEPRSDEQPQAVLDQLPDGVVVAIGAANGPMGRGYLKNDGGLFTFVKGNSYEDKPEFKYQIVRQGNVIGVKSIVSGKILRSSKSMGYALKFDAADMSSPEAQFVLWAPSNQKDLSRIWLYNRATQGFISVRNRPDEVVTYDHTNTGAQHAPWEELFLEVKTSVPAPTPAPVSVDVAVPTVADLKSAQDELKKVEEELKGLRKEVDRLTALLAQETKKKSVSDEEMGKLKVCDLEKAELMKKVVHAEAERERLFTMLMQAVEQLRALMNRVKQGETLTVKAVMAAAPLATTPVGVVPGVVTPVEPVAPKPAVKKAPVKKKKAIKKKAKKAKKSAKKKTKKAGKKASNKKISKKKKPAKRAGAAKRKKASKKKAALKK